MGAARGTAARYRSSITRLASPFSSEAKAEAGSCTNRNREKGHWEGTGGQRARGDPREPTQPLPGAALTLPWNWGTRCPPCWYSRTVSHMHSYWHSSRHVQPAGGTPVCTSASQYGPVHHQSRAEGVGGVHPLAPPACLNKLGAHPAVPMVTSSSQYGPVTPQHGPVTPLDSPAWTGGHWGKLP